MIRKQTESTRLEQQILQLASGFYDGKRLFLHHRPVTGCTRNLTAEKRKWLVALITEWKMSFTELDFSTPLESVTSIIHNGLRDQAHICVGLEVCQRYHTHNDVFECI